MYDNTHIQTVATYSSRSRQCEPSNSGTFVKLNGLDYKRPKQTDHEEVVVDTALSQDKLRVRI